MSVKQVVVIVMWVVAIAVILSVALINVSDTKTIDIPDFNSPRTLIGTRLENATFHFESTLPIAFLEREYDLTMIGVSESEEEITYSGIQGKDTYLISVEAPFSLRCLQEIKMIRDAGEEIEVVLGKEGESVALFIISAMLVSLIGIIVLIPED